MRNSSVGFLLLAGLLGAATSGAQELTAERTPAAVAGEIDAIFAAAWEEAGVRPSKPTDDSAYLRRVSLDLQGVIPSEELVRGFLQAKRPDRARLVRDMLHDWRYARSQAVRWANLLLGRKRVLEAGGDQAPLVLWLRQQFAANRPWDVVTRELLAAEGREDRNGAVGYLLSYRTNEVELAGNSMRVFQGVQIQCAQCHDHPFDDRWKQEDFWGVAAFFTRADEEEEDDVRTLVEERKGKVRLPAPPGEKGRVINPRFLTGQEIDPGKGTHRRKKLAELVTGAENPYFAPATVNRVWSFLFGKSFGDPDDMAASELVFPRVLDLLVRDFRQNGYDMRRLFTVITSTQVYQLSSAGRESAKKKRGQLELFARASLRPLSPEQLWASLGEATGLLKLEWPGDKETEGLERVRQLHERFFRVFAGEEGQTLDENTIPQALALINGPMTNTILRPEVNPLVGELLQLKGGKRLQRLYLRTLSRAPSRAETRSLGGVGRSSNADVVFLQDLTWSLLNSSEFVYNH